jgi:anthrone oxygenase-like protein
MILLFIATITAGLFAGAAVYITAVEHPARISCGTELALREFAPSYKRATVMQAALAVAGCISGLAAAWQRQDLTLAVGALLLGAVVPFTLVVIFPTNARLLDPALDPRAAEASQLLEKWGRLHAVRSVLSTVAFLVLLMRAAR